MKSACELQKCSNGSSNWLMVPHLLFGFSRLSPFETMWRERRLGTLLSNSPDSRKLARWAALPCVYWKIHVPVDQYGSWHPKKCISRLRHQSIAAPLWSDTQPLPQIVILTPAPPFSLYHPLACLTDILVLLKLTMLPYFLQLYRFFFIFVCDVYAYTHTSMCMFMCAMVHVWCMSENSQGYWSSPFGLLGSGSLVRPL